MEIIQSILTKNPCYTSGQKIKVKGLMLHSVGCPQPNAQVFITNWNSPNYRDACVHGFIDGNTGAVYQTLPWNHRGWHAGGSANNTHVGVEMCEPSSIKYTSGANFTCLDKTDALSSVKRTYNSAVQLFAMLCKQYELDPLKDGVIVSHKEGGIRGIASGHVDPEHLWTQLGTGYTMNGFRNDVKKAMLGDISTIASDNKIIEKEVSYLVRIGLMSVNIFDKPSINSVNKGSLAPGAYTIIAESDGTGASKWGKLKSGIGWIPLDRCIKIGSSIDEAIEKLAKLGVIDSPEYWKQNADKVKYLDELMIKAAAKITGKGTRSKSAVDAIKQLVKDGIINTPDYWMLHYKELVNLDFLLCALAGAKKG